MNLEDNDGANPVRLDFETLVARHYEALYRFAYSLTRSEADACDLTQQTFCIWASKGSQLKDSSKVKCWLFTTLHRAFLETHRRSSRFPHFDLEQMESELPELSPVTYSQTDTRQVLSALKQLEPGYRSAVSLFYLEDYAYKEIAQILNVPLGTVKSRIARGLDQLHDLLDCRVGTEVMA